MLQPHPSVNLSKRLALASSVFARHEWLPGSGNVAWLFHPGMLFANKEKWWGAGGVRQSAHEGLDFCYFLDAEGNKKQLGASSRIPVLFDGEVVSVFEDLLGMTVLVKHEQHQFDEHIFFTIYAHIFPFSHIKPGFRLSAGEQLGQIAATLRENSKVPEHLHLSVALVPKTVSVENLNWELLSRQPVTLSDPLDFLEIKYKQTEGLRSG